MAMKIKDEDPKKKKKAVAKKPATVLSKPQERSIMFAKGPAPKMNAEATGERNWDRSSSSRATISAGPATINMGGKTAKSTGGMNMSKGTVKPKSSVSPGAKMNFTTKKPYANPTNQSQYNANVAFKEKRMRRQGRTAYGVGALGTLAALNFSGDNNYVKQAGKWIKDTPIRKEAKRVQKAENDAMIVERNKGKGTVKASKSTMKKLKAK